MDRCVLLSGSMLDLVGNRARKESTCSMGRVRLDSDDLPMGVMRERGMARCCMIDNAEARCCVGGERAGAGCRMWWDVLSWWGRIVCGTEKHRESTKVACVV